MSERNQEQIMTPTEVADYLRVSPSTLRYWRIDGRGPGWRRVGKHVRYTRADVEKWFAAQPGVQGGKRTQG